MLFARATHVIVCFGMLVALTAAMGCSSPPAPRDTGPRRDAFREDTNEVEELDASELDAFEAARPDADLDADLDAFDPSALDADQDVGPIDAFVREGGTSVADDVGTFDAHLDGAIDARLDARLPAGACGILWERGAPLPEACLPRCSRATRDLFSACAGDGPCEAFAMTTDESAGGLVYVYEDEDVSEVDCESCVGTQRFSCWYVRCADQATRWVDCVARGSSEACSRERDTLDRCLLPFRSETERCTSARVAQCFP